MLEKIKKISTFLAWAVFTFLSHFSAKQFLSSSEHLTDNVILLTSFQMAAGSVLFLKMMISGRDEVNIPQQESMSRSQDYDEIINKL